MGCAKWTICVAGVLLASGAALGQTQASSEHVQTLKSGQAGRTDFWQNPDRAWLSEWYANRDKVVQANQGLPFDTTSILVMFTPNATAAQIATALKTVGGRTIETWGLVPGLHHVAIVNQTVADALATIKAHGFAAGTITFAEPDFLGQIGSTPNDTFYGLEWGLNNTGQTVNADPGSANADIDADLAWDVTTGSTFVVGMCDSGIRKTHEDLAPNLWTNPGEIAGDRVDNDGNGLVDDTWGWDFWNNDNKPEDDNGHGSHTAGTVGAKGNNAKGVTGVCWNIKLAGLKIGSRTGSISVSAAIGALNYCTGKGIKLSNHSWGGGAFSSSMNTAITNARTAGHMLVCAAGNGGADGVGDNNDTLPQYPAGYSQDNIISVAAINNDNGLAGFSNFGATTVDIGAPGVMIASCYKSSDTSYVYLDGTSMAAPHVTGVAALVWSVNPAWTYSEVRSKILSTAKPIASLSGKCATGGCVNTNNAVR